MKRLAMIVFALFSGIIFFACTDNAHDFDHNEEIIVVARERGSGTRSAFVEIMNIEVITDDEIIDLTTADSIVAHRNSAMISYISNNIYAIGYMPVNTLDNSVATVSIDGVLPTIENIKDGSYHITRTFSLVHQPNISAVASDFVYFVLSPHGQDIIAHSHLPTRPNVAHYSPRGMSGRITISGSSSTTPIIRLLSEFYMDMNPDVQIYIDVADSCAGIAAAIDGTADIGLSSRSLRDDKESELILHPFAIDGIAVVVHHDSPITELSSEQVRDIFMGNVRRWGDLR